MTSINVTGLGHEEKEALEQAAEDAGMSLSEFCRTRLRAGYRLWDAGGEFDVLEMQDRLDETQPADSSEPTSADSGVHGEQADRFAQNIMDNLPTNTEDAVSKDEIVEIVSDETITDVLSELKERGDVEYVIDQDGFVRSS